MNLLAFAASHRADSINLALLEQAASYIGVAHHDIAMTLEPFSSFDLPLYNDVDRLEKGMSPAADRLRDLFAAADAVVIASPEYNWSVPAHLKNLLDWMSCYRPVPFENKPVFLMSASPSERGGVLGLSHLKTVLEALDALPYPFMMLLGHAPGSLQDEAKITQLHAQLDAFIGYAKRLASPF